MWKLEDKKGKYNLQSTSVDQYLIWMYLRPNKIVIVKSNCVAADI